MAVDRVERGKYEIHLRKLIEDASTSTPKDIMAMYYGELEKFINSNPRIIYGATKDRNNNY